MTKTPKLPPHFHFLPLTNLTGNPALNGTLPSSAAMGKSYRHRRERGIRPSRRKPK